MRRFERLRGEDGFTLAEVLLSIALLGLLLAALSTAFAGMTRLYRQTIVLQELVAEARFAAQSIVRDITYAQRVQIDGERIEIFTQRGASSLQKIVYRLDEKSSGRRILKDGQPLTGDSLSARVSFAELRFALQGRRVVCVDLTAVDLASGRTFSVETAAFLQNWQEDGADDV